MIKFEIVPISLLAVIALSACGGGSSGGGTLALLNIGTTSTTASPNGLPFAETGVTPSLGPSQFPDDEFGADGSVVMAIRSGDGVGEPMRVDLAVVPHVASGGVPNQLGDERLTLQIDGRALQFLRSGSAASNPYTATSGDDTFELSVNTLGRSSTTRRVTLLDGPDRVPVGIYTFGFQTNPSALPTVSAPQGRTDYVGTFRGFAIDSAMSDRVGSVDGQLTLSVVFETGEVSGAGNGHLNGRTIAFDMDATEIVGNGFSSTLTFACPLGSCSSRSQIGGAFFRADAAEISGLILIDETVTRPVDLMTTQTVVTTGAAGYSAEYLD